MHIAIITGWSSTEREISLNSAANLSQTLQSLWHIITVFDFPSQRDNFLHSYPEYDLIFPCIHGVGGEDGQIAALAILLGKKYVFADTMSHSLCLHKYASAMLAKQAGLTVPDTIHITTMQEFIDRDCQRDRFIIKPNSGWSSVDTAIFTDKNQTQTLVQKILTYDTLVIQNVIKARELTVSVFGTTKQWPEVLAITEIQHTHEFFDIEAKYDPKTLEVTPAPIDASLAEQLQTLSIHAFKIFACKDFARIDYLRDGKNIYFLEVNTIPGMTANSIVPRACTHSRFGWFPQFLDMIIQDK
jgi:D-alanine-D-alanine ligase